MSIVDAKKACPNLVLVSTSAHTCSVWVIAACRPAQFTSQEGRVADRRLQGEGPAQST